jgi:hypothetical protein
LPSGTPSGSASRTYYGEERYADVDIRPRTLGEILDDAWRLVLADLSALLLFHAAFLLPAFTLLLLLLAQPAPSGFTQIVLPVCAAVLLPLMGLASGASQELFRRRTADEPVSVRDCLTAALRHAPEHLAARALLLCFLLPGPLLLLYSLMSEGSPILRFLAFLFGSLLAFLLTLPVWGISTSLHTLLSEGKGRSGSLFAELRRDVAGAPGRAAALVLGRLPLFLLLVLQLHLLVQVVVWIANNLAGFDMALLDAQLAFLEEPVYTLALLMVSWLLLAPFFEASNFLLHTDIRIRQEGLDLQYRVQRLLMTAASGDKVTRRKEAESP